MSLESIYFNNNNCFLQNNKIKINFNAAKDKTIATSKIKYQYRYLYTPILLQIEQDSSIYAQYESDINMWTYSSWQNIETTFSEDTVSFESVLPFLNCDSAVKYEIRAIDDGQNNFSESNFSNIIIAFFNSGNIISIKSLSLIQSENQKISSEINFEQFGLIKPFNFKEISSLISKQQYQKYLSAVQQILGDINYNFSYFLSSNQTQGEEIPLANTFLLENRPLDNKYNIDIPINNKINSELSYYLWIKVKIISNNNYILISSKETTSNFKMLQSDSDPLTIKRNGIASNINRKNTYQVGAGIFNHSNGVADKNKDTDLADSIALLDNHTFEGTNSPVNEPSIGFYDNDFNKKLKVCLKNIRGEDFFYFEHGDNGFGLKQKGNGLYRTERLEGSLSDMYTLSSTSGMTQKNDLPKNIFNKYCYEKNTLEDFYFQSFSNFIGNNNYIISFYIYSEINGELSLETDRAIIIDTEGEKRNIGSNQWILCTWILSLDTTDLIFNFSSSEQGKWYISKPLVYDITKVYTKELYSSIGSINKSQKYSIEKEILKLDNETTPLKVNNLIFTLIRDVKDSPPTNHASVMPWYGIAEEYKFGHIGIMSRNISTSTSKCNADNPKVPITIYYGTEDIPSTGVNLNSSLYCKNPGTYIFVGGNYSKTNFPSDFYNSISYGYGFILETKLSYNYYGIQFLYQTATNKIWYRSIKSSTTFTPWMRIVTSEISGNNTIEQTRAIANINPNTNEIPYVEDGTWTLTIGNNQSSGTNCKYHRIGKICQVFGWLKLTEDLTSNSLVSGFPFTSVDTYQFLNINFQGGQGSAPDWTNKGNIIVNLAGRLAYMSTDSNGLLAFGNAYEWGRVDTYVRIWGSYMIKY